MRLGQVQRTEDFATLQLAESFLHCKKGVRSLLGYCVLSAAAVAAETKFTIMLTDEY